MVFFVLALAMVVFASSKVYGKNEFNNDYISRDGTAPIKGIFVFLILLSHASNYFRQQMSGVFDDAYFAVRVHMVQMIVVMFLFYSGYGIMEQIKKRKFTYVKSILTKRFPNLLLNYDIAAVFYIILALFTNPKSLTVSRIFQLFIGWEGLGNSTWFICVTLILYLLTFISFLPIKKLKNPDSFMYQLIFIIVLTGLTILLIFLLKKAGKDAWWYNTIFLFPFGFWYSHFKTKIEKLVMKSDLSYVISLSLMVIFYVLLSLHKNDNLVCYILFGCVFALTIVVITMKVKIESPILNWYGDHVFSIYILQRIPMTLLWCTGLATANRYSFTILSIAITCIVAALYDKGYAKLSSKIWKPKKN